MDDPAYDSPGVRYLLGRLNAGEPEAFERAWLADQAAFEQVLACEAWLLDQFEADAMPADERAAMQARYAQTARGRERLRLGASLGRAVAGRAAQPAAAGRRVADLPAWWRRAAAVAALAVLAITGAIMTRQGPGGPSGGRAMDATPPATGVASTPELPGGSSPPPAVSPQRIELIGGITRDDRPIPAVRIGAGIATVEFALTLTDNTASIVDVRLRNPKGDLLREWLGVRVTDAAGAPTVAVTIPASALTPGLYEFTILTPPRAGAAGMPLDYLYVAVGRRP